MGSCSEMAKTSKWNPSGIKPEILFLTEWLIENLNPFLSWGIHSPAVLHEQIWSRSCGINSFWVLRQLEADMPYIKCCGSWLFIFPEETQGWLFNYEKLLLMETQLSLLTCQEQVVSEWMQ